MASRSRPSSPRAGRCARCPCSSTAGRTVVEASDHRRAPRPPSIAAACAPIPDDPRAALDVRMLDRFFDNYVMTPMQKIVADAIRKPRSARPARRRRSARAARHRLPLARRPAARAASGPRAARSASPTAPPRHRVFYADWSPPDCHRARARARLSRAPARRPPFVSRGRRRAALPRELPARGSGAGPSDEPRDRRVPRDANSEWIAELACGHRLHQRPPTLRSAKRPWVLTPEGRQSQIGIEIDCSGCDRRVDSRRLRALSPNCGLRREHGLEAAPSRSLDEASNLGAGGSRSREALSITTSMLRSTATSASHRCCRGSCLPEVKHHVAPAGPVSFFVEFLRAGSVGACL